MATHPEVEAKCAVATINVDFADSCSVISVEHGIVYLQKQKTATNGASDDFNGSDASRGGQDSRPNDKSSGRLPSGKDGDRSLHNNDQFGSSSQKNQRPMNNQKQQQQQ